MNERLIHDLGKQFRLQASVNARQSKLRARRIARFSKLSDQELDQRNHKLYEKGARLGAILFGDLERPESVIEEVEEGIRARPTLLGGLLIGRQDAGFIRYSLTMDMRADRNVKPEWHYGVLYNIATVTLYQPHQVNPELIAYLQDSVETAQAYRDAMILDPAKPPTR